MSQIQSNSRVLEDTDDALIASGQAQILGEGDEVVDLNSETVEETVEDPKKKKPEAQPAAAAPAAAAPAAAPAPAAADTNIPAEYRGKTLAEVIEMHRQAQQAIGRQGHELGELRRVVDTHIRRQPPQARPQPQQPAPRVQIEDSQVFAKPVETISQLIENHPLLQEVKRSLGQVAANTEAQRMAQSRARFQAAHPDAGEILADPEFRSWVNASPKRQQMLEDANAKYDFESGDEVFSTWKALSKVRNPAPTAQAAAAAPAAAAPAADGAPSEAEVSAAAAILAKARAAKSASQNAQAAAAAAPTSGASAPGAGKGGRKLYRRSQIIDMMINRPEEYEARSAEIQQAYAEKRVI